MVTLTVLDKGYVELVKYMTNEEDLLEILAICHGKKFKPEDTDRLIDYIMRHDHSSVLEHIVFRFKIKCPIFVARQWMRHRIGSYTEASLRGKRSDLEFYIPNFDDPVAKKVYESSIQVAYQAYEQLLQAGVKAEQARCVLPLCTYTEFYWTVNMRSLLNFLKLRLDASAQWEIRQYAQAILKIVYPLFRRILKTYADN